MGTALTGTTPQDTYDSLIKVTDNGPLSGSLKVLTDGLGNDSALALSTGAASVTGTLSVSSNGLFGGSTNAGNAGTNTLSVGVPNTSTGGLQLWSGTTQTHYVQFGDGASGAQPYAGFVGYAHSDDALFFGSATAERMRITSAGNVGIGTSTPQQVLDTKNIVIGGATIAGTYRANSLLIDNNGGTSRFYSVAADTITTGLYTFFCANSDATINSEIVRIDSDGLKFNGDTAAANALDDYEEGTWTMGVSFGGASVGLTTSSNTGTYTKIGRQVTVNGFINLTSKGSSTGNALITGLPFTIANSASTYSAASLRLNEITFQNQFQAFGDPNTTTIILQEITELGVSGGLTDADFANTSDIMVSLTYFV